MVASESVSGNQSLGAGLLQDRLIPLPTHFERENSDSGWMLVGELENQQLRVRLSIQHSAMMSEKNYLLQIQVSPHELAKPKLQLPVQLGVGVMCSGEELEEMLQQAMEDQRRNHCGLVLVPPDLALRVEVGLWIEVTTAQAIHDFIQDTRDASSKEQFQTAGDISYS